jgi:hypothetical protein
MYPVLVSSVSSTYEAQIRTPQSAGFKLRFKGTCTMGERFAAKHVVRTYYGDRAAESLREATAEERQELCGNWPFDPRRTRTYTIYIFNPAAR